MNASIIIIRDHIIEDEAVIKPGYIPFESLENESVGAALGNTLRVRKDHLRNLEI